MLFLPNYQLSCILYSQISPFLTYLKFHFYQMLNYLVHSGPFQNYLLTFLSHVSPLLPPSPPSTLNSGHT